MANISKIKLPGSDTIYKLVDTDARKMIENLPSPMVFKGTLGAAEDNPTITELPEASASTVGHTYKVITAGTYAGQYAKIGDVFTCAQLSSVSFRWVYIPSGDEPSGTVTNVATGTGLTGGPITTSGTISMVAFTGATAETAGVMGGVPAPAAGDQAKYLQANGSWSTVDALPSQAEMGGKFLTTNGTTASWATVDALPSQSGQSGKFLTTDGTTASWAEVDNGTIIRSTHVIVTGEESSFTSDIPISDVNKTVVYQNGILLTYGTNYTVSGRVITLVGYTATVGDIFTIVTNGDGGSSATTNTYTETFSGPGTYDSTNDLTTFTITHGFNTKSVIAQVYDETDGANVVCEIARTSVNVITLTFKGALTSSDTFTIIVMAPSYKSIENAEENEF